ncbi:TFIIH/NER complex subunit [Chytridiales sp. JEL 0842]|nr:TFIIH/NER complex subunit [Chytridiales sp. JEL 0842]
MESSTEECPVCKSNKYINPSMKLLVSPCYHKMCENCINRLFQAGPAGCPVCKQTLRKSNFVAQTFEDLRVEKEVQIRKRIGKYFNKRLEDFDGDLRKYNDYLEEAETMIFNLINEVDVQSTNEKIEKFRQENNEIIAANIAKQMNEDKIVSYRLKKEREEKQIRKEAYMLQAVAEAKARLIDKADMLEQLATSDESPQAIIENFKKKIAVAAGEQKKIDIQINHDDDDMHMHFEDELAAEFDPVDHMYIDPIDFPIAPSYNDP